MRKFTNLLTKEIKELITLQLFISLLFTVFLFYFIGQMAKSEVKKALRLQKIAVLNLDTSPFSQELIQNLRSGNFEPVLLRVKSREEAIQQTRTSAMNLLLVIPEGFGQGIERLELKPVETYTFLRSLSIMANRNAAVFNTVLKLINNYLSNDYLKKQFPDLDPNKIKNPIKSRNFVLVKDKMAEGSAEQITGFITSQSLFVPIILMMIIIYSSQMVISAIAMEKQNKTLETLLTVPISRTSIVTAKMMGAAVVGLISAIIYMVGFRYYMAGFMGDVSQAVKATNLSAIIQSLGLALSPNHYLLLGLSLFLAILCGLAMATILGVLAEDYRSAQSLIMPLVFLVLIPYFLSFFADFRSMSLPVKILVYLIPFSHPFLASQNLLLGNYGIVFGGILYMLLFFGVLIFIAARIFSTDKVLTMKLRFRRKKVVL